MFYRNKKPDKFNKKMIVMGIVFGLMVPALSVAAQPLSLDSLQRQFVDKRFGMFIHFNMNTYVGGWANDRVDPLKFNPTKLDCAQWASAAKAAGMKYGMLTAKHHDGFTLWPSKQIPPNGKTQYTIAQSSQPTMDVVKEYVKAFRDSGLAPGLYMSMFDVANGVPRTSTTRWTPAMRTFVLGQITELLTQYGEIPLFQFDGYAWAIGHWAVPWQEIRDTIKALQPNCLIIETNGETQTWESDILFIEEVSTLWLPPKNTYAAVSGYSITGGWFYSQGYSLASVANIVTTHLDALNPLYCNVQLNCPPNKDGVLDAEIVSRLTEVGKTWKPNLSRAPMPKQPPMIESPITPVTATATSGNALKAIDGVLDRTRASSYQTLWESTGALPQSVTLDLGKTYDSITYLFYLPRREPGVTTGNITSYKIYTSANGTTFNQITTGTAIEGGTFGTWAKDSTIKRVSLAPQTARYIKLEAIAVNGGTSAVICDLSVGGGPRKASVIAKPEFKRLQQGPEKNIRMACGRIALGADKRRTLAVYDPAGHFVGQKQIDKGNVDLHQTFGTTSGVYIVRVQR